jgi:hypothetical protein
MDVILTISQVTTVGVGVASLYLAGSEIAYRRAQRAKRARRLERIRRRVRKRPVGVRMSFRPAQRA